MEDGGVRTDKTLKGWLDPNGTSIEWTSYDIDDMPSDSTDFKFSNTQFLWPASKLPRTRGCYNWGPLDGFTYDNVVQHCGHQPDMGTYDGTNYNFTASEQNTLDELLNNGTSPCPVCDIKEQWRTYYLCAQRFNSMKAEASRCEQITSSLSALSNAAKFVCSSKLQLCVKFRSVTFSSSKIEICPIPSINVVTRTSDNMLDVDVDGAQIPDANPVIFGCIDFPGIFKS